MIVSAARREDIRPMEGYGKVAGELMARRERDGHCRYRPPASPAGAYPRLHSGRGVIGLPREYDAIEPRPRPTIARSPERVVVLTAPAVTPAATNVAPP